MDPTLLLAQVRDSLSSSEVQINNDQLPLDLVTGPINIELMLTSGNQPYEPVDEDQPLLDLPMSIFTSPMSIVMANLDSLYPFTSNGLGWLESRVNGDINYAVLGDEDSGAAAYVQYRTSTSWGYTLVDLTKSSVEGLDLNRLVPLVGNDGTGQLTTNWDWFIKRIRGDGDLLDFIICLDSNSDLEVVIQTLIAISVLRDGGRLVLYLPIITPLAYNCLVIISQCFEQLNLVRPFTLSPRFKGCFLIAQDCRKDDDLKPYRGLLQAAITEMNKGIKIGSFIGFSDESDTVKTFEAWAQKALHDVSLASANQINALRNGQLSSAAIDYHKLLLIFNLPDGHGLSKDDE